MPKPILFSQRSGRFNLAQAPIAGVPIALGSSGAFYRIMNSGTSVLKVPTKSGGPPVEIAPRQSADLFFDNNYDPLIIPSAANAPISGIYDLLPTAEARSGRFAVDPVTTPGVDPTTKRVIIDLSESSSTRATYRFFNSGTKPFSLWIADETAAKVTLAPDQSLDWTLPSGAIVKVNSANATDFIAGSFDLIVIK